MRTIKMLFLFAMFVAIAQCQSQKDLNEQANKAYKKVDLELNNVYKKIIAEYSSNTLFIKNLREAQRQWIKFRYAQVQMKYPRDEDGTTISMCKLYYLTELTEDRIKQLRVWLEGVEEGDICSGSIKNK